ncbi:MAG: hypothetical protein GY854_12580, partial [Deltaproteobacteria bacterium]|nr:hypothetical protein [Deltaproteobacteria bacterium]
MVRPMLLAYIESLMEEEESYEYAHQIYEAMVRRWIKRERVKNKEDLRLFSEAIAVDMYRNQEKRKGLFVAADEIGKFAERHGIRLQEFELKGRSLLNRDAEGRFKFAHKSILEYLLALELIGNAELFRAFKFEHMDFARSFLVELCWSRHWVTALAGKSIDGDFRVSSSKKMEPLHRLTLEKLKNADSLRVNGGTTEMLMVVAELRQLKYLYLDSNQIADVSPLKNLTKLNWLYLNSNQIADVSPLKNLTKLEG